MFSLQLFSKLHILLRVSLEPDAICDTVVLVTCHKNKYVCALEKLGYLFKEGYCSQMDQAGGKNNSKNLKQRKRKTACFGLYQYMHMK